MSDDRDNIPDDAAWPVNIEAMSPTEPPKDANVKVKKFLQIGNINCWVCLLYLIALLLLIILILLAVLFAIAIPYLFRNRSSSSAVIIDNNSNTTTVMTTLTAGLATITNTTPSITSTETTTINCGESCLTQSWIDSSNYMSFWPFDTSFDDTIGVYNPISSVNLPTLSTGFIRQAALFDASAQQSIYTQLLPLTNTSFTVEAWIKPTGYPNPKDHSIVGLCPVIEVNYCLHITIRNEKLYFGFYYNDVQGQTTILTDQWIHSAFVYDSTTKIQLIYLNGILDGEASVTSDLLANTGFFTIGANEVLESTESYFQGYIDQLLVTRRAKSDCEVLERATLAARFNFDSSSPYTDSGPNTVSTTQSSSSIVDGYRNQAISFTGTSTSYFQAWSFTSFGISNQPFSISLWIKPETLSGTLVHLSTSSTGEDSTCFPLLGFAANGAIVAQVLTGVDTIASATGPIISTSTWIPIVQTWSIANGLKLYVNGSLVSFIDAERFFTSETTPNYLTLGNCLDGCETCSRGSVGTAGPYTGTIDDWRIFNRELTSSDVCALYYYI